MILVCTLHNPDTKLLPLYYMSETARSLGARYVNLIAPYLSYMRQDIVFEPGEGITSSYFANLVSLFADGLVTIDPHLHRHSCLSDIYKIPCEVGHAAPLISKWIKEHVNNPFLIGPDEESTQWVSEVAQAVGAPYTVLHKIRHGDRKVEVTVPEIDQFQSYQPVLVDDIISTGNTMMATIKHLLQAGLKAPICVAVHAVFAGTAYQDILDAGARQVITTNSIPHSSNGIDLSGLLSAHLSKLG